MKRERGNGRPPKGVESKGGASKGGDRKGKGSKGKDSKGKDAGWKDFKGKDSEGKDSKGGKTLPKVEEGKEETGSTHASHTAREREQNWGPPNRRNEPAYHQRGNETGLEYVDGTWRVWTSPRPDEAAAIHGVGRKLGLGEFAGGAISGVLT